MTKTAKLKVVASYCELDRDGESWSDFEVVRRGQVEYWLCTCGATCVRLK